MAQRPRTVPSAQSAVPDEAAQKLGLATQTVQDAFGGQLQLLAPLRAATENEAPVRETRAKRAVTFAWGLYGQVATVFGAFSLAAFAANQAHVGWRGFLATLIDTWDMYVRPVTKWSTDTFVSTPMSWLGLHVEVPEPVRDYLSVGIILTLSTTRFMVKMFRLRHMRNIDRMTLVLLFTFPFRREFRQSEPAKGPIRTTLVATSALVAWPLSYPFVWPISVIFLSFYAILDWAFAESGQRREIVIWATNALSPLIYLSILLILNYWVLQ